MHLAALAPAGVAACCVAWGWRVDRRRSRTIEIVVAVLMLATMIDLSRSAPLVAPVVWAVLLLLGAITLAASTRQRWSAARAAPRASVLAPVPVHAALGCVVMAALVMLMVAPAQGAGAVVSRHHAEGARVSVLIVVIVIGVLGYVAYSVVALRRGTVRERVQSAAMGASTLAMAAAIFA